jgi:hypothetical protein
MNILLSFCNTVETSVFYQRLGLSQLAVLDTRKDKIYFIKLPQYLDHNGITGITIDKDYVYAVTQARENPYILKFSGSDLTYLKSGVLEEVRDAHSLTENKGILYICSTGSNSVEMYDADSLNYKGTFWQHPDTDKNGDEVHLNGIIINGNDLWVSCFGKKRGKYWTTAASGYIINTSNNKKIYKVTHPHSINSYKSEIYYCESTKGSVLVNARQLIKFPHTYVRGLSLYGTQMLIGISSGRKKSRSTGDLNNPIGEGRYIAKSGLCILDTKNKRKSYYSLIRFGREIYDVVVIPGMKLKNYNGAYDLMKSHNLADSPLVSILFEQKLNLEEKYHDLHQQHEKLKARFYNLQGKYDEITKLKLMKVFLKLNTLKKRL